MNEIKVFFLGALFGAYVGYKLNYNLYDWTKDHILFAIGWVKAKISAVIGWFKKHL